ncbi:FAD-dependent monooxygenase [Streptomyces sp. NPDC102274]|uniref:FAD-dependent monooxygenase n=1 Tax=Streptomyces sp. NPDC102274 TaxID=3366151 RepID=UPI003810FCDE
MGNRRAVLVVGGGTAGNSLAVLLRAGGIAVDLVEVKDDWNVHGSGIFLQYNALRVLHEAGVGGHVRERGFVCDAVDVITPGATLPNVQEVASSGGDDGLAAGVAMERAQLQRILVDAVRGSGATVRLGCTVADLRQRPDGVDVSFTDGGSGLYDLVVGADGPRSATRAMIGVPQRPEPTGMGSWRAVVPRPRGVERHRIEYGGPCYVAGYCPTGKDTMYAYLTVPRRDRSGLDRLSYAEEMRRAATGYGGAWDEIRESLSGSGLVTYTSFDRLLLDGPWHRGRCVLIGDAAHCCPPTLAQGAAMALEDASVLAELLTRRADWDDELFRDFAMRRGPRVRMALESSVRLGRWLMDGDQGADVPGLMGRVMATLKDRP